MKAKTLTVITLLAVLALTLSGPATASVGAGQAPVEPAAPLAHFPLTLGGDREGAGEGPGVRVALTSPQPPPLPRCGRGGGDERSRGDSTLASVTDAVSTT